MSEFLSPIRIKDQILYSYNNAVEQAAHAVLEDVRNNYEKELCPQDNDLPTIYFEIRDGLGYFDEVLCLNRILKKYLNNKFIEDVCKLLNDTNQWIATYNPTTFKFTVEEKVEEFSQESKAFMSFVKMINTPIELCSARGFGTVNGKTLKDRAKETFCQLDSENL